MIAALAAAALAAAAPPQWTVSASDGVRAAAAPSGGATQVALDYDFGRVSGYAVAARAQPIDWPENFLIRLRLRGTGGANELQVKFTDGSGENVWWHRLPGFRPGRDWQELRILPRDIEFAWGPAADKRLRRTERIELVVVRGRDGGAGRLEPGGLELVPLPPAGPLPPPRASDARVLDGDPATAWAARPGDALILDFGGLRALSALTLAWQPGRGAGTYRIETSDDGRRFRPVRTVQDSDGGTDPIALPGTETRWLRIRLADDASPAALAEATVHDADWAPTLNAFIARLAAAAPRGRYPRGFVEQPYWTLVGSDGGAVAGLIGEDGAVEPAKGSYSVEPFLTVDGAPFDWAGVTAEQTLEDGQLPIATSRWQGDGWRLETTAFATAGSAARLLARWRVTNGGTRPRQVRLTLAVRPLQVNPPAQFLAQQGGVSPITAIAWDGRALRVTAPGAIPGDPATTRTLWPARPPDEIGMAGFDRGALATPERLPPARSVADPAALAQAALSWSATLAPGQSLDIPIAFAGEGAPPDFEGAMAEARSAWQARLGGVSLRVPPAKQPVADTLRTALAHMLISRAGPALKPGTRSYDRSWIRDGAMMADALLRLGVPGPAIEFADWYGQHLFANGKVPCCVDARGADPVPENDSHGQYIHLLAQLHRYTGDRARLARDWTRLDAARRYMDALRLSERTPANRVAGRRMLYGLLPPSISHEGYSEKAQHSLWDDFWGLAGYDGALHAAQVLGRPEADEIAAARDQFAADIVTAVGEASRHWGIDFIPGATSLGDFDATSTTMALEITALQPRLDPVLLANTFERQWRRVTERPGSAEWDDYTPYELRNVSAFVRLGWRERANRLLDLYMADRRPAGWNGWAEVVGRNPREIRFIGDMPHAWVASDFIRAALDLFAYERRADAAMVLAGGMTADWLAGSGSAIAGLRTPYGAIDLEVRGSGDRFELRLGGTARPPGGFEVRWPFAGTPARATVNGAPVRVADGVLRLPATGAPMTIVMTR